MISTYAVLLSLFLYANSVLSESLSHHVVYRCPGSVLQARKLAEDHNLIYVSEVFPGSHLHHAIIPEDGADADADGQELATREYRMWDNISNDPRVSWAQRQVYQPRETRYVADPLEHFQDEDIFLTEQEPPGEAIHLFNDPFYPKQWYLHGIGREDDKHLNVIPVWKQGYSGRGVKLSVLDDTVNVHNPDIGPNFDPEISGDLSKLSENDGQEKKKNPMHGTYCASVIAAVANNSMCGVGVAFNSNIGGVRLLMKKRVLDLQEGKALNFQLNKVDIYSASWGPPDDGAHIGGPGFLAEEALSRGVNHGRNGLGAIYVWASGNGGPKGDNCGYDNYASNIRTLTVSALTPKGLSPFYAEHCPSALTSIYVGGRHFLPRTPADMERAMRTADVIAAEGDSSCTTHFQGTSAAAPLAAGIIALLLEANPKLTWRDVQHLIVLASSPPNQEAGWVRNSAGLLSHPLYGFGALNATTLIDLGKQWKNVPPQKSLTVPCSHEPFSRLPLLPGNPTVFHLPLKSSPVDSLEYVTGTFSTWTNPRGALEVSIKSPSGMVSRLLVPRPADNSTDPLINWSTSSAQFWGEDPAGTWSMSFLNTGEDQGFVESCSMTFYGF